jgi:Zn-dependent protease
MHDLRTFALTLPVLLAAMVLHELAHGAVAWRLGDPTARMMGRLTLNPIRHLDRLGTAMFAITFFGGLAASVPGFAIGWAKPVPVVPEHFRSPQRGMALVAVAGPLTNLLIAAAFAAIVFHVHLHGVALDVAVLALLVNITLFLFNLLPIPPLDGSRIVGAAMNDRTYERWLSFDRYGVLVVIGVVLVFNRQFQAILGDSSDAIVRLLHAVLG